jgi:transcriptional regulator with XRE-family HTH domain
MMGKRTNIYKNARRAAGLTQEQAAEHLYISVRSLAEYEAGRTIPACNTVCRMIETFNTPWLAYEHLRHSSEVGQKYLPEVNLTDLAKSVLRLQKELQDVVEANPNLVAVACDGVIHPNEEEVWKQVSKEVMEMVAAGLGVLFSQKEKAPAFAEAR